MKSEGEIVRDRKVAKAGSTGKLKNCPAAAGYVKMTLGIVLLIMVENAEGQSLHFSQFFNSPLTTNPANTGFIPDANYRVGINYRNQWSSVMSVPYSTTSVFGDAQLFRNKMENGWLGLGGLVIKDAAGAGKLTTTRVAGSVAYHQMLGYASLLSLGFQAGWINKQINAFDLRFPDQFDGKFFSSQVPSGVALDVYSVSYADVQIGMNYAYFPNEKTYVNAGFAAWNVNRPRESFFSGDVQGIDSRLPRRYIGFLNGSFKVSDLVILNPMAYYTRQTTASDFTAGLNAQYNLGNSGEIQLLFGLYYRYNDAVVPLVGFTLKNIRFFFTYDATVSSLSKYNQGRGALEFAAINYGSYNSFSGNRKETLCPVF